MKQIVFLAGTYDPDRCGVAHYTAHLRRAIAPLGLHSTVLTTRSAAQATTDATVVGAVQGWHLADLVPLVAAVHRSGADLLHIQHAAGTYHFQRAVLLLPLLLRLTGWHRPIVTTVHEYGWWEWQPHGVPPQWIEALKGWGQRHGWWDREDGFLLTQSQAIVTTNGEAEDVIHHRLPHLMPQVHRIPIAANVAVVSGDRTGFRQQIRRRYSWPDDAPIVAFFGFLHPVKGLETLLAAFQAIAPRFPLARLLLIGGVESLALQGPDAEQYWRQLQDRIGALGLEPVVQMTGYLEADQVSQHLSAADVGVLPFNPGVTRKSGSLLAMLAHHLPVIATQATPADPDLTDRLIRVIPSRQETALVTALTDLLSDPQRAQQLAAAGYAWSRQLTWPRIAQAHAAIYHALLSDHLQPRPAPSVHRQEPDR